MRLQLIVSESFPSPSHPLLSYDDDELSQERLYNFPNTVKRIAGEDIFICTVHDIIIFLLSLYPCLYTTYDTHEMLKKEITIIVITIESFLCHFLLTEFLLMTMMNLNRIVLASIYLHTNAG